MERHIDKHRGVLDEMRMREMLLKLQNDLGIRMSSNRASGKKILLIIYMHNLHSSNLLKRKQFKTKK